MIEAFKQKIAGEIVLSSEPGKVIKKWREEFGVTQNQLADAIGISHSVISDYESGRRKSPGTSMVKTVVEKLIEIDVANGSSIITKYNPDYKLDCIIAMGEFSNGIDVDSFIKAIGGRNANPDRLMTKNIYGYTIVDSVKAILSLGSEDYLKIYGWNTERALIFMNVHYGRSPMVAIRAHPLKPAMVVYLSPDQIDPLAVKLARLERLPLVITDLTSDEIADRMEKLKEEYRWK
jgi:putative transcriptional regulator